MRKEVMLQWWRWGIGLGITFRQGCRMWVQIGPFRTLLVWRDRTSLSAYAAAEQAYWRVMNRELGSRETRQEGGVTDANTNDTKDGI